MSDLVHVSLCNEKELEVQAAGDDEPRALRAAWFLVYALCSPGAGGALSEEQLGSACLPAPFCHQSRTEAAFPLQDHYSSIGITVPQPVGVAAFIVKKQQFLSIHPSIHIYITSIYIHVISDQEMLLLILNLYKINVCHSGLQIKSDSKTEFCIQTFS